MAKPVDQELRKAFSDLQMKMVQTKTKIKSIDNQLQVFKHVLDMVDGTRCEINALPPTTRTYEAIGRTFLLTEMSEMRNNLKNRESQLKAFTVELKNNKEYLENNLKESEDNLREMVQQRKEQGGTKNN